MSNKNLIKEPYGYYLPDIISTARLIISKHYDYISLSELRNGVVLQSQMTQAIVPEKNPSIS